MFCCYLAVAMATESLSENLAALSCVPGVGRRTLARIFYSRKKHRWHWSEFWVLRPAIIEKIPIDEKIVLAIKNWQREYIIGDFYVSLQQKGIRVVAIGSEEYPQLLAQSEYPPVILFAQGAALDPCPRLPIAVVGTRQITSYGRFVTSALTKQLCQSGATIISGCMYGVDTVAHETALEEKAHTIAVLGFGFDHVYQVSQAPVLQAILAGGGTILSEYAPQTRPVKGNFIARNSIVAGLSAAVLVTEAAQKSGSHTTAQFALESGRSVCAVPGPIYSPYSEGTKWLINEGAVLVTSAADILTELGVDGSGITAGLAPSLPELTSPLEQAIIAALQTGPQQSEEVFARLTCSFAEFQACLTKLELDNYLERMGEQLSICY